MIALAEEHKNHQPSSWCGMKMARGPTCFGPALHRLNHLFESVSPRWDHPALRRSKIYFEGDRVSPAEAFDLLIIIRLLMNACVRDSLDRYREDAPFSDRHSGAKPSRDSTFGEAHISYMKKIGAVFPAFLTSLTPQADVFHAVHCRF